MHGLRADAVQRRSTGFLLLAIFSAFAALFCHSIQGTLLICLLAGIVLAAAGRNDAMPRFSIPIGVLSLCLALSVLVFYLLPLGRGWNGGIPVGPKESLRNLLSLVNWTGVSTVILALVGAAILLRQRPEQARYWAVFPVTVFAMMALLPLFVVIWFPYAFPMSIGTLVLAGCAIGSIFELLNQVGPMASRIWFVAACGLNISGLISYYADGNRCDHRPAARYIESHLKPGDRFTGNRVDVISYYAPACAKAFVAHADLTRIRQLTKEGSRLWIVFEVSRSGLPENLRQWVGRHCRLELRTSKPRLDYHEYVIEVYLWSPEIDRDPEDAGALRSGTRGEPAHTAACVVSPVRTRLGKAALVKLRTR